MDYNGMKLVREGARRRPISGDTGLRRDVRSVWRKRGDFPAGERHARQLATDKSACATPKHDHPLGYISANNLTPAEVGV